jgi:hypothetical protein
VSRGPSAIELLSLPHRKRSPSISLFSIAATRFLYEPISKIGFWLKIEAGRSFKPEAYCCMSRIYSEAPTKILGQKTFLRWVHAENQCGGSFRAIIKFKIIAIIFMLYFPAYDASNRPL